MGSSGRPGGRHAVAGAVLAVLLCGACGTGGQSGLVGGADGPDDPVPAASPSPSPEDGPSTGYREQLDALAVRPPGTMDGYARERFAHWSAQGDGCDTREVVLERDGEDVRTDEECDAVAGTWRSPYDDGVWTDASDVDIDHMVPLAEAWRSGARGWSDERREAFANDLKRPQLWAVTDNVNQSKGDSPPDEWKPERRAYWCTYATHWVAVKHHYELSVTKAEKGALTGMLDRCRR